MRLGLRGRITALLLVLSIAPPGAMIWFIRQRVLRLVRAEDAGRIEDALTEFGAAIEREGADTAQSLAMVSNLLEGDPRYRETPPIRPGGAGRPPMSPNLADAARRLMQDVELDCLTILDDSGAVLSSGLSAAQAVTTDRGKLLLPETTASFIEENITPGVGRVLTLQSRRRVGFSGATLHLVGGRFIDDTFLKRLSPGGTVRAVLLDRDGAILAAGDPDSPLPVPPRSGAGATSRGEYFVHGVPHSYRTIDLKDGQGRPVGALVAAVSQERLARLSSTLTLVMLGLVAAGAGGSLLLGFALSRGVTRPLRRLEQMSERIAHERFEPVEVSEGVGEIAELVTAFNKMASSLADSRERLRQTERLAAAEDVARRVAHEIKNPLSPIALTLEGLVKTRQKRPLEFDAAFDEAVRTIQEEIQRMRGILEDFSRFGRLPLPRPRPCDLNELLRTGLLLHAENPASARIILDLEENLPPVLIDPDRVGEVIDNLILNAVQAIGVAGGDITVSTRARDDGAELHFRDTGPGMSPETLGRLFEPYVSGRAGGSGLGLAICRRIVLDHGGRIEAGNRPEGGAWIRILLPWAGKQAGAADRPTGGPDAKEEAWRTS